MTEVLQYRNHSIDIPCWIVYDRDLRHERVNKAIKLETENWNSKHQIKLQFFGTLNY